MIIKRSKNGRWIIPFKKISRLRVKLVMSAGMFVGHLLNKRGLIFIDETSLITFYNSVQFL